MTPTIDIRSAKDRTFVRAGIALGEGIAAIQSLDQNSPREDVLESTMGIDDAARHFAQVFGPDKSNRGHPVVDLLWKVHRRVLSLPPKAASASVSALKFDVMTALDVEWAAR